MINYAQRIKDAIREDGSKSYHALFPLMKSLRTSIDTRGFMEGYIEFAKEVIQEKLDRNEKGIVFDGVKDKIKKGKWSLEDAARHFAADTLPLLANIYEANTDRKPQRSWNKILELVCPV